MARRAPGYRLGAARRAVNILMTAAVRAGVGPRHTYLLTTVGRRTGTPHPTPVTLVENTDGRWLVAPYGPVSWVYNARAAGQVSLYRRGRSETCSVIEAEPEEAAPVLKAYVSDIAVVRPYFDAAPDAPLQDFAREAPLHPVFRLQPAP